MPKYKIIRIKLATYELINRNCLIKLFKYNPELIGMKINSDFIIRNITKYFLYHIKTKEGIKQFKEICIISELPKKKVNNNFKKTKIRKWFYHNFSADDIERLFIESEGICNICKKNIGINRLTIDHIIPISKVESGHIYSINDIQLICRSCNARKSNKTDYITPIVIYQEFKKELDLQ